MCYLPDQLGIFTSFIVFGSIVCMSYWCLFQLDKESQSVVNHAADRFSNQTESQQTDLQCVHQTANVDSVNKSDKSEHEINLELIDTIESLTKEKIWPYGKLTMLVD